MSQHQPSRIAALILVMSVMTGCLAGPRSPYAAGSLDAGFFTGLWHGILAPLTLIASFLNENVRMYEAANSGPEYDLGFLMGVILLCLSPILTRIAIRLRRRIT